MSFLSKKFTLLALIFSSFTVWFAVNEYLRLNILFVLLAILFSLLSSRKTFFRMQKNTRLERQCILIFILAVFLSFIVNVTINEQPKCFSNFIGTIAILFTLYFCYGFLVENNISTNEAISALAWGGIVLMAIVVIESTLSNFFGINIHNMFIFGYKGNSTGFVRSIWTSVCGPCEEPGVAAQYLNVLIPFSIYKFKGWKRIFVGGLFLFCLFTLFSSTGLATFLIIGTFLLLFNTSTKKRFFILTTIFIVALIFITLFQSNTFFHEVIEHWSFWDKVTLSNETKSGSQRAQGMLTAIKHGIDSPLWGMGPGYGKYVLGFGYLSTFLTFLGSYGVIAFSAFVTFWCTFIYKVFHLSQKIRAVFIYSFLSLTVAACIGDLLNVFALWMILPIINKAYNENKQKNFSNGVH